MYFIRRILIFITLLVLLALTACTFSTAGDVTPPPSMQAETAATKIPTQVPSPTSKIEEPEQSATVEEQTSPEDVSTPESSTPQSEQDISEIVFMGTVVNLSGGEIPAGLQVILQGFESMNIALTQTTELTEDGTFSFQLLENVDGLVFIATIEYEGLIFGSDVIHAEDLLSGDIAEMTIGLYEKSDDATGIFADRAHIFLDFVSENRLQVVEYLLISNPTDHVVAGSLPEEPVLTFSLPADATNLQFEDSGMTARFIAVEGGFGDLMSIRPGMQQHEILFAYELPYDGKHSLDLMFPVNILSGTLVIPDGIKLKSDQVTESEPQEMENGLMQIFSTGELLKDTPLHVDISGKPGSTASGTTSNNNISLAIGLGIFAVVLILSGLWLSRKPKKPEEKPFEQDSPVETEEEMLDNIIELDQAYEAGALQKDAYEEQRSQLKEKLKEIRN